jgi:hypothetical protein
VIGIHILIDNESAATGKVVGRVSTQSEEELTGSMKFMEFLRQYQGTGLAVAGVIGTSATKPVNSTVTSLIMPMVWQLLPRRATGKR